MGMAHFYSKFSLVQLGLKTFKLIEVFLPAQIPHFT